MSKGTLYDKVLEQHVVDRLAGGKVQVFIDRQYIHEVTSPQAFDELRERGIVKIPFPHLNTATVDHIVPTDEEGWKNNPLIAQQMEKALEKNCKEFGIEFLGRESGSQGIVHIVGPELGLTQPGTTNVCGDSHTSTHGAFGNVSWGIGTTQVAHVLASQTLSHQPLKTRLIRLNGKLQKGVTAKDVAINAIRQLGVKAGNGYAHEYGGPAAGDFSVEERMTICNMGIEGNARVTYFNPDDKTYLYLQGKERVPKGEDFERALAYWKSMASDADAKFDHSHDLNLDALIPTLTWGTNPGQAIYVDEAIPFIDKLPEDERGSAKKALKYMKFNEGEMLLGKPVNMVFIGSCTNGRLSDLELAAAVLEGYHIDHRVKVVLVPGSQKVKKQAEEKGLDKIFEAAGINWRDPGCSMCLGMNTDRAQGDVLIASTSNRNYEGRQGDYARTVLMSPTMAAHAAIHGKIGDIRSHEFKRAA
jgi:3-isopropylmalate/(R)-2-methylmalate dehydratase large subunit